LLGRLKVHGISKEAQARHGMPDSSHYLHISRQLPFVVLNGRKYLPLLSEGYKSRRPCADDFPSVHPLQSQKQVVVGEWHAARHPRHVRLYGHCYMLMATGFEGRIEDRMGLGMLEEGEAGRDGREVGGRRLGCACSGSRAGTRRPTLSRFPLLGAEWQLWRHCGIWLCVYWPRSCLRGWVNSGY
jgi:hypothetical protein